MCARSSRPTRCCSAPRTATRSRCRARSTCCCASVTSTPPRRTGSRTARGCICERACGANHEMELDDHRACRDGGPVMAIELPELTFNDQGLIAAIAQDPDGRVLMMAWMSTETLRETLETGRMVYWSRSRKERWAKGDTSGDIQVVKEAWFDCDGDVLLFVVDQHGKGACATGEYSCFFRDLRDLVTES